MSENFDFEMNNKSDGNFVLLMMQLMKQLYVTMQI